MFKVNDYFDGKVKSIAFQGEALPATVGVMAPGDYEFGTQERETMTVVSGALTIRFPGTSDWQRFEAGDNFQVDAGVSFKVRVDADTAYLCTYG